MMAGAVSRYSRTAPSRRNASPRGREQKSGSGSAEVKVDIGLLSFQSFKLAHIALDIRRAGDENPCRRLH